MPKKSTTLAIIAGATTLVLAACGSNDDGSTGAGADAAEIEGSLFAFGFGYDTGDEIAQVRVDRFRELYPDVDVDFSESGFEEQPFLSALASGDPPDLVNIPRNIIGTYIARGVLQPLDECLAKKESTWACSMTRPSSR